MSTDSRTGRRFPLELPITFRSKERRERGKTSNVSAAGVYILSDTELEIGSEIEFELTLPADVVGGSNDVTIRCRGRVLRTEERDGKKAKRGRSRKRGVACVIENYKFLR